MAKNTNIDKEFLDQSWSEMKSILDQEMPVDNRRNKRFFWVFFSFALMALISILIFWPSSFSQDYASGSTDDQKENTSDSLSKYNNTSKPINNNPQSNNAVSDHKDLVEITEDNNTYNQSVNSNSLAIKQAYKERNNNPIVPSYESDYINKKPKNSTTQLTVDNNDLENERRSYPEKEKKVKEVDSKSILLNIPLLEKIGVHLLNNKKHELTPKTAPVIVRNDKEKESKFSIQLSSRLSPEVQPNWEIVGLYKVGLSSNFKVIGGLGLGYDNYTFVQEGFYPVTYQSKLFIPYMQLYYGEDYRNQWYVNSQVMLEYSPVKNLSLYSGLSYRYYPNNIYDPVLVTVFTSYPTVELEIQKVKSILSEKVAEADQANRSYIFWTGGLLYQLSPKLSIGGGISNQLDYIFTNIKEEGLNSVDQGQSFIQSQRFDIQLFMRYRF